MLELGALSFTRALDAVVRRAGHSSTSWLCGHIGRMDMHDFPGPTFRYEHQRASTEGSIGAPKFKRDECRLREYLPRDVFRMNIWSPRRRTILCGVEYGAKTALYLCATVEAMQ